MLVRDGRARRMRPVGIVHPVGKLPLRGGDRLGGRRGRLGRRGRGLVDEELGDGPQRAGLPAVRLDEP